MLHRSEYATKHRQERILRITLSHEGFLKILSGAVPTFFVEGLYPSESEWRLALERCEVRYQWDPDRDLEGRPLERRAIQLGLRGGIVWEYAYSFIRKIEDAPPLAHAIRDAIRSRAKRLPEVPEERPYPLEPKLFRQLWCG